MTGSEAVACRPVASVSVALGLAKRHTLLRAKGGSRQGSLCIETRSNWEIAPNAVFSPQPFSAWRNLAVFRFLEEYRDSGAWTPPGRGFKAVSGGSVKREGTEET